MRYCAQCGEPVDPGQAFCRRCGAALRQPDREAASPASVRDRRPPLPSDFGVAADMPFRPSPGSDLGNRRRRTALAAVVLVVVLGGGALAGWLTLGHTPARSSADQADTRHSGGSVPATAPAGGSGTTAAGSATASASTSASAATSSTGLVRIAQSASQNASAPQVADFLGSYFRAINNRDYSLYASLFVTSRVPTRAQFRRGYRSTHDSDAILTRLRNTPNGLAAAVSFTSHQAPADSATGTSCTAWNVTFYLTANGSGYQIGNPPADYHARYRAC